MESRCDLGDVLSVHTIGTGFGTHDLASGTRRTIVKKRKRLMETDEREPKRRRARMVVGLAACQRYNLSTSRHVCTDLTMVGPAHPSNVLPVSAWRPVRSGARAVAGTGLDLGDQTKASIER